MWSFKIWLLFSVESHNSHLTDLFTDPECLLFTCLAKLRGWSHSPHWGQDTRLSQDPENHHMVTACTRRVSIWDDCSKTPHSYMRCCNIDTWRAETCPDAGFWRVWEGSLYGSIDHRIHTALCDCLQTVDHIRHISVIAKLRVVFVHVLVNSSEFWMFFGSTDRCWD